MGKLRIKKNKSNLKEKKERIHMKRKELMRSGKRNMEESRN